MIGSSTSTGHPEVVFRGREEANEEVYHFPPNVDNFNIPSHDAHDVNTSPPYSVYSFPSADETRTFTALRTPQKGHDIGVQTDGSLPHLASVAQEELDSNARTSHETAKLKGGQLGTCYL